MKFLVLLLFLLCTFYFTLEYVNTREQSHNVGTRKLGCSLPFYFFRKVITTRLDMITILSFSFMHIHVHATEGCIVLQLWEDEVAKRNFLFQSFKRCKGQTFACLNMYNYVIAFNNRLDCTLKAVSNLLIY